MVNAIYERDLLIPLLQQMNVRIVLKKSTHYGNCRPQVSGKTNFTLHTKKDKGNAE